MEFWKWQSIVLKQVRFRGDWKAVSKELEAHYDDHVQALVDGGCETGEARRLAVEALGDPEEVGRALNRVHKFWLGMLWEFSRLMVLALALLAGYALFTNGFQGTVTDPIRKTAAELSATSPDPAADRVETPHGTLYLSPGAVTETAEGVQAEVHLWAQMDSPAGESSMFWWDLALTGDQGPIVPQWEDETAPDRWTIGELENEGWTRYETTLHLTLRQRPEWVEVAYPYGGNDWALRAEWRESP